MIPSIASALALTVTPFGVSGPTSDRPYILQKLKGPNEFVILQFIDRKANKVIWKAAVGASATTEAWSHNGRAVVVFVDIGDGVNRFLIWRAGEKLHDITGERFGNFEGPMEMKWSPRAQWLLLRLNTSNGTAGAYDMGDLWYLDATNLKAHRIAKGVSRERWTAPNRILYWTKRFETLKKGWRVPVEELAYRLTIGK